MASIRSRHARGVGGVSPSRAATYRAASNPAVQGVSTRPAGRAGVNELTHPLLPGRNHDALRSASSAAAWRHPDVAPVYGPPAETTLSSPAI